MNTVTVTSNYTIDFLCCCCFGILSAMLGCYKFEVSMTRAAEHWLLAVGQ